MDCGTCDSGKTCDSSHKCTPMQSDVIEPEPDVMIDSNEPDAETVEECTPKTCSDLDWACGSGDNGCGGTVDCGKCDLGSNICDSSHKCTFGCTPKTCSDLGWACGPGDDGCGDQVDCGTCDSGKTCDSNHKCLFDTWTDQITGYEWQVNPSNNHYIRFTWQEAIDYCNGLGLAGGGWHLPSISELRTLIRGCALTKSEGSCKVTDACLNSCWEDLCNGCAQNKGPGPKGVYGPSELQWPDGGYWSSSSDAGPSGSYYVDFGSGAVLHIYNYLHFDARCVRAGP